MVTTEGVWNRQRAFGQDCLPLVSFMETIKGLVYTDYVW